MKVEFRERDIRALRKAIRRSPDTVARRSGTMMNRIKNRLQQRIMRNPWEIGGMGGGAPVKTGSLRDAHRYSASPTEARVWLPDSKADAYGRLVHEGTYKMEARPWMDYAVEKEQQEINNITSNFLDDIVQDLAK